jgi:hypothetical protein
VRGIVCLYLDHGGHGCVAAIGGSKLVARGRCPVVYPLEAAYEAMRHGYDTATLYNLETDLDLALQPTQPIAWWDSRRFMLLSVVNTTRPFIWLGDVTADSADTFRQVRVAPLAPPFNQSVIGQLLRHLIVTVDASSNDDHERALAAWALVAPFVMRKLPGIVEYLGNDYPLYYSSYADLQALLDNETLLRRKMFDTHVYLQQRDTSRYSWIRLSQQMANCTLQSMSDWPKPRWPTKSLHYSDTVPMHLEHRKLAPLRVHIDKGGPKV